jgi:spore germination protein KA
MKKSTSKHRKNDPLLITPASGTMPIPISRNIEQNEQKIHSILGTSPDLLLRKFNLELKTGKVLSGLSLSIDGLIDTRAIGKEILEPLLKEPLDNPGTGLDQILGRIYGKKAFIETDLRQGIENVLNGAFLLIFDGYDQGIAVYAEKFNLRSPDEPPSETIVKGSREGFIESTGDNMAMIRRRIRSPGLRFESFLVGEVSGTKVTLCYMEGIVEPEFLDRVRERIKQIKVDGFEGGGQIEQYLEDSPYTPFPTIGNTERPDRVTMMLLEGRTVILIEGTPITLIAPYLFVDAFKSVEDYNSRPFYTSFVRCLRFVSFLISILSPALFVGALDFHKSMIPSEFINSIKSERENVPFPLVMEVFLMTVLFEIVREAGIRMPRQIGQALSIVGALILGQVSVQAGLIAAPTIIVVSLAAIATFMITPITDAASILRIGLIVPTSVFGFFGLSMALLGIITHMVSLTSLGEPYMAPFAPVYFRDWKDTLIRVPLQWLRLRPDSIPHVRSSQVEEIPPKRKPFS